MKLLLCLFTCFSLSALATEEMCEEQTEILTGADLAFVADLAKRHEVPNAKEPSLIKRQFEIEIDVTPQGNRYVIKTPVPLKASSAEKPALDRLLQRLNVPSDNLGGPILGTSIWLVQNNGQPDLGDWYVNYTCYETEGTAAYISEERSLQESDVSETSAKLQYAPVSQD